MCHRCWYVIPDELKRAYTRALSQFRSLGMARDALALIAAETAAIESVNPGRGT